MTAWVYTPLLPGRAIELGHQLWRKRVLPVGDVSYKGRMLHFTRDYLDRLADAFRSPAPTIRCRSNWRTPERPHQ